MPPTRTRKHPFTVVLAVRDQEAHLGRRIRAIRAAVGRRGRVRVFDLGSSDNSLAVLRLLRRRYSRLSVETAGPSPPWHVAATTDRGLVLVPESARPSEVTEAVRAVNSGFDVVVRGPTVALSPDAVLRLSTALESTPRNPASHLLRRARAAGLLLEPPPEPRRARRLPVLSPVRLLSGLLRAVLT